MYVQDLRDGGPDVVLTGGRRTPTGRLTGSLSEHTAVQLGARCLEALEAIVDPRSVDELILGSVLQAGQGQAPARQVLIGAGWSPSIPAVTINKVCGSGLKAILQATEAIRGGPADRIVAGGTESMSRAPHIARGLREGRTLGDIELTDAAVHDGLWCAVEDEHMGHAAERIARRYDLSREALDRFALRSHRRAARAEEEGYFDRERVPVDGVSRDEPVRSETSMEALGELRPAFEGDGVVTAGNAPGLNDGASAVVVARESALSDPPTPRFRLTGYAVVGDEPGNLFETPAGAIELLLEQTGGSLEDFDRIEINEAFSSQVLANCHRLELDPERVNHWGGAVALGHPIGMSGNRIVLTLMNQLAAMDERRGLAAICMGGGNGIALSLRREA